MAKAKRPAKPKPGRRGEVALTRPAALSRYDDVLGSVVYLIEDARRAAARSVNAVMTTTYWEIGRRIVEEEQGGKARAEYGQALLARLAADLTARFGRGFSERNLEQMRAFHLAWPIPQTASAKSSDPVSLPTRAARFSLPWLLITQ